MSIANVISWKFNNQAGMRCKEIKGVMTIVEFPGGIPLQADQDTWTQEYTDWIAADGDINLAKDEAVNFANVDPFLKAYILAVNKGTIVPGSKMSGAALKKAIKAEMQ